MIDFQKEYWIIRIQITIKTYSTLNICILSGYSNSKDRIISTYFVAFQLITANIKLQVFIFDLIEFDRVLTHRIDDIQYIDDPSGSEK